ncbi:MAG: transglycosylase SLT domain-containing protein [Candidatus Sulfopaludibacter sp.]|nr:transglycosylase SLT domain-containing protein [Candidatus Sulfopaludibacter sp.]
MPQQGITGSRTTAWLLSRSGALAGTRFQIAEGATRIGRAPDNDVIIQGANCATVSLYHLEISKNGDSCRLRDLDSTNGTWVNGERITESEISLPSVIQLGSQGPEFELVLEEAVSTGLSRTIEVPRSAVPQLPAAAPAPASEHEALLSSAVTRARRMRAHGVGGHTMAIMRGVIDEALHRTRRRFRIVGYSLLAALLAVSAVAVWKIVTSKNEKRAIDTHIQQLEAELQKAGDEKERDRLLSQLGDYQNEAESLQRTLLYRLGGARVQGDYVTQELHAVMAEFGAEAYSIPPDFIERVNHYIEQDQGPDHPVIARALSEAGGQLRTIRNILREGQLPEDLAYIPLVESALRTGPASAAGAVGPWQFTPATARAYGLRVDAQVDERKNLVKSTQASCKYLRDLILDFGTGSSVMLALAAYDSGPTQVKQAVTRTVRDPIKQRNFWYLYRVRALPLETREYVPKVFAAILIGRNPHHFGF